MPIQIIKSFPIDHQRDDEAFPGARLLYFDPVQERLSSSAPLADRVRQIDPAVRNCDLVIVRGRTDKFLEDFRLSQDRLARLIGNTPLLLCVGSDKDGAVKIFNPQGFGAPKFEVSLNQIRQVELGAAFRRAGAIFSGRNYHYELPSGRHASKFVRVADALQDPTEVARLADWIFPHVSRDTLVVGDTGSLLPLLLTIRLEAQRLYGWDISIRTINEYPVEDANLDQVVWDIEEKLAAKNGGTVLFLVSVNSTGKLIRRLRSYLKALTKTVVICNTGQLENCGDVESLMSIDLETWDPKASGECEQCHAYGALISIDRRTYERIPKIQWKAVALSNKKAMEHKDFWVEADKVGAVHLHVDVPYPGAGDGRSRHHSIYLDIVKLLESDWIRTGAIAALKNPKVQSPKLVIIPKHNATEAVGRLIKEVFSQAKLLEIEPGPFSAEARELLNQVGPNESILIADDALVGGSTLISIRQELYNRLRGRPQPRFQAFVVVSRPSDLETAKGIERIYRDHDGAQFYRAHQVYLPPHSDTSLCPWCAERSFLVRRMASLSPANQRFALARIEKLTGALKAPFLLGSELSDAKAITHGSFFGDLSLTAGFAAASNAIQELRVQMNLNSGSSERDIINIPMAIQCYFDAIFLAAIFRTCQLRELDYVGQYQLIAEELQRKDHDTNMPGLVAELGWAAVQSKLPIPAATRLLTRFVGDPACDMLAELLEQSAKF